MQIKAPKKLIEVALPLDDINKEAALRKRKAPYGYPTALHKWWAQRPPAAARAVLFAQLVNDPGYESGSGFQRGINKKDAARERERLFAIIRKLVLWENTNNEAIMGQARDEIRKSWRETCRINEKHPAAKQLFNPEDLPAFYDPFGGSGAIPLEAQRLGLKSYASDLNPVAVLINKAMIEIPPKFSGQHPVGPSPPGEKQTLMHQDWTGGRGLGEDVRRYGHWVRQEAEKRIGHLYPRIEITPDMAEQRSDLKSLVGQKVTVVAWLWARTVRSPNPAYSSVHVPLASTFLLSSKSGKEVWVEPVIQGSSYRFEVRTAAGRHGKPPTTVKNGTKAPGRGSNFLCLLSDSPVSGDYIKAEGQAGRMEERLMAVVAEGARGRVYLDPNQSMEEVARAATPAWRPDGDVPSRLTGGTCFNYGLTTWGDLFTRRQLAALNTFSEIVSGLHERIRVDAVQAGLSDDHVGIEGGGSGATAYAEALVTYLSFAASRAYDYGCSIATWRPKDNAMRSGLSKQAIPMTWDFAEGNPFGPSSAGFVECATVVAKVVSTALAPYKSELGHAAQRNAAGPAPEAWPTNPIVSTDPPYYDNIGYADLSDFYYVCLRRILRRQYPSLFATVAVPKAEELVATAYRHGGKKEAEEFFLAGMTEAMHRVADSSHPAYPLTIYYAFKQSETKDKGTASTGWETFLAAVLRAGLSISGTWPVQTEGDNRQVGVGNNALASSIILVCRRRPDDARQISRREFQRELKDALKEALDAMLGGADGVSPIAPVDLAQAAIGPGMAVFSQYAAVLEANGESMSVHTALTLINRQVDEVLDPDAVGDLDGDTKFCAAWFKQHGWSAGPFGDANTLAQAKATSVDGVASAGVIDSKGGKVKLLKPAEYPTDWDPSEDNRTPVWEALHQLIRALSQGGEFPAGALLARMPERAAHIRQLATWLYTLCERNKWADDARSYNELVAGWHGIEAASHEVGQVNVQGSLDV